MASTWTPAPPLDLTWLLDLSWRPWLAWEAFHCFLEYFLKSRTVDQSSGNRRGNEQVYLVRHRMEIGV